jgi:uncharacterized protein
VPNADGETALISAAAAGEQGAVAALISAGANIHIRDNRGKAAVDCAASNGDIETIGLLVTAGADPEVAAAALTARVNMIINPIAIGKNN